VAVKGRFPTYSFVTTHYSRKNGNTSRKALPPGSPDFPRVADFGRNTRRNGTRPRADKPKDHEPEVQATATGSVLPGFRPRSRDQVNNSSRAAEPTGLLKYRSIPASRARSRPGARCGRQCNQSQVLQLRMLREMSRHVLTAHVPDGVQPARNAAPEARVVPGRQPQLADESKRARNEPTVALPPNEIAGEVGSISSPVLTLGAALPPAHPQRPARSWWHRRPSRLARRLP
jgi:hypothetical protein